MWCPATERLQANPGGHFDFPTIHFSGVPDKPTNATESAGQPEHVSKGWPSTAKKKSAHTTAHTAALELAVEAGELAEEAWWTSGRARCAYSDYFVVTIGDLCVETSVV